MCYNWKTAYEGRKGMINEAIKIFEKLDPTEQLIIINLMKSLLAKR
jgi:hypothetical protein